MAAKTAPPPYVAQRASREASAEEHHDIGFYTYLHLCRKRKWILIGAVAVSLSIAAVMNAIQRPVYQSSAELVLQAKESQTSAPSIPNTSLMQDPTFLITQIRLIRSSRLAERAVKKLESLENRKPLLECFAIHSSWKRDKGAVFSPAERQALSRAVQRSLGASQVERARIIAISATGYVPAAVALVADAAAKSYVELNYEFQVESFQRNFSMISKSLGEIREKIKIGEIAVQKIDLEIRLLEALKIYEQKHPLVLQLRSDIPSLANKLAQGIRNFQTMQFAERRDSLALLVTPHIDIQDLKKIETDLHILKPILEQEVTTSREMYNSLFKKLQEVELAGGNSWVDAKIVETASIPGRPIRPNKKMNLVIGLVLGLFIGLGLAFFIEYLDSSIQNLEDVRNYLRLFPLGMVPHVALAQDKESGIAEDGNETDLPRAGRSFWLSSESEIPLYVGEAYRMIRTNLTFGAGDTALKVLQVTSAVKGEGKTTTAANLAISFAQAGMKTLLVDADLRRPSVHRILGLGDADGGLSEGLASGGSWESLVEPTRIPNLFCIPAGAIPPNPAELLSSKNTKALLEELKNHFDMILVDSPPVISVADSSALASQVDGIVLISRSGFIPRYLCLQAKNTLESVNGKLIGCVLNGIQNQHHSYYYYRYYHKYGDYYGETQKQDAAKPKQYLKDRLLDFRGRLKTFPTPLLAFLSGAWIRFRDFVKWEGEKPPRKEKAL